jgi:DNA polymerase-3 subunit epsilon
VEFVAIDFETANESRASACEVSLVRFVNGEATESLTSFVYQNRFNGFNTLLHGMDEKTVKNAPRFWELWPELRAFIGNSPLVAHYAGFDMSVLFGSLEGEPVGAEVPYFCSLVISRRMLELTYYGLPGVADHLGVVYPMEHRAESDARAAGEVACRLLELGNSDSFPELAKSLKVLPGLLTDAGASGSAYKGHHSGLTNAEKEQLLREAPESELYSDPDFAGRKIVFTGAMLSMTRTEAEIAVMKAGGLPSSSVSSKTNLLVFGYQDPRVLRGQVLSSKRAKAVSLKASGADIEVVDEMLFLQMLAARDGLSGETN